MGEFARDVLLRLKWGEETLEMSIIKIISRGRNGGTKIVSGRDIDHLGRSFIETKDGTSIPYHRVIEIWYEGEKIWDREEERD
jgi:uncharacterized protein (UPF0248 family)